MLGYDAQIYEVASGTNADDLDLIRQVPYAELMAHVDLLKSRRVAHLHYPVWVDHLLDASTGGRAQMLHDGGYPYLFHAVGVRTCDPSATAGPSAREFVLDRH